MAVHMLIGPVGAGKTTFARRLERECSAVRFTLDEWMTHLYGHHMARELFDARVDLCMGLMLDLTQRLTSLNVDVALDCGFWTRESRRAARERLRSDVRCYYFDAPREIRWQRIEERNRALPPGTFEITREMFELFDSWFERPDVEEHIKVVCDPMNSA